MSDPLGLFEDENKDPLGLFDTEDNQGVMSALGETALNFGTNMALTPLAGLKGIGTLLTGGGLDKATEGVSGVMEEAYQPRGERGKRYAENLGNVLNLPVEYGGKLGEAIGGNEGRLVGEIAGNFATDLLPIAGGLAMRGRAKLKAPEAPKVGTAALLDEINAPKSAKNVPDPNLELYKRLAEEKTAKARATPITVDQNGIARTLEQEAKAPQTPTDYHATEGLDGQRSLFDIPEEGRMPNPYEAVTGDWRIDENGMPVKTDLSMDVANTENIRQRNLFGDELTPKHPQESQIHQVDKDGNWLPPQKQIPLTEAIDSMDWAHRRGALKKTQLGRGLDAPGELLAAKMAAEPTVFNTATRKQGGAINPDVFVEGFQKIKELADGIKLIARGTGDNLNIRAVGKNGEHVAGAVYDKTNKYDAPAQSDMYAKALGSKQRGVATQLYKFANELGNDIVPSKKLTEGGAAVWKKMEKTGLAENRRINFKKQGGGVLVDWGSKKNLNQLKENPAFAERLKHAGNSMIASPAEAVKLSETHTDVKQNVVQKTINQLTKGGIYLKAKVDHPVVHYTVDSFLKADKQSRSLITEKIHNEYLGALRSLSKQERIDAFTLLNAADLNKTQITPDMIARAGLSEKLSSFLTQHASLMGESLTKINEARVAAGKKPITAREAYSAFNMTGDYRKVAYKTIDGKKEVVGVVGANTMGIGKNSLSKLEAALKTKDPAIEFGPLIDKSRTRQSAKGTPHEAFTDVLKTLGEDNPHMKEFLDTLAQVAKDDPTHYMGMDAHTLQKKGVWGMEGRKQWLSTEENAKAFFENQVRYAEGAMQWGELSKAAKDVNNVLRNEVVATKHQNAVKLSEDYMYNALGMNPSDIGNAVNSLFNSLFRPMGIGPSVPKVGINMARQVANTWMMSLSPMFLAMNAIQPLAAMPGMVAYLRGKGMDSFGIVGNLKAMKTAFNELEKGSLSPMEQGALKYAKDNHVYATDMVEHSNQTEKGAAYYTAKVTQSPAAYVETGTRKTVYLTLVHALHDGGLSVKDGLYEQAAHFTDVAMNNYSNMEKPPIYNALGPVGTMAYNLKSFGHNEISRWSLYAREAAQTGNAVPFLTQMATTIAMAGVMGLPFFSQWEALYDQITKSLGNPKSLALDVMNVSEELGKHLDPKAMYALSHGLWSLTGADASTRLGLGDVLPNNAADAAFAGGGKLASMIGSVVDVARQRNEETAQAALYNLAPPIAQGPLDLAMYTKDDLAYSKDPSNLKPTARRNEVDKTMRAIGITGINESVQKTKNYQLGQIDKSLNDIRTKALNTIAQDIFRDRSFDQKTMDKYFVDGQGDPQQFEQQVGAIALKLSLSPEEFAILKDSASKSITKARSLQRRMQ